jgi:hypothetical protein
MKIIIEFDSCWQTGFLGGDPNKSVSKKENDRSFIATSKTRGEKYQPITLDTVVGVLLRLIGEQRKLYQARLSDFYYFRDIEGTIDWTEKNEQSSKLDELMYLTNKSDDRCAQSSFLGVLDDDNPWFFSENSHLLWSILFLNKEQLIGFINSGNVNEIIERDCSPKNLISRINVLTNSKSTGGQVIRTRDKQIRDRQAEITKKENAVAGFVEKINKNPPKSESQKSKNNDRHHALVGDLELAREELEIFKEDASAVSFDKKISTMLEFLSKKFPDEKKLGEEYCKNGTIYPASLYSAALYIQAEHLLKSGCEVQFVKNSKNEIQIQGFSKRGFNGIRDWLNAMAGGRKKAVGTPCIVQKHSGKLEIELRLDSTKDRGIINPKISRADEISKLIENAGVSSFYLGKKGLAYVSNIRV